MRALLLEERARHGHPTDGIRGHLTHQLGRPGGRSGSGRVREIALAMAHAHSGPRDARLQVVPLAVAIVAELSAVNAIHRLRAIQGIIRLRDTYGDTRLDAACARALAVGDPRYRTVKGILVAGTEHGDDPPGDHNAPTPPAMLRGPDAFDTDLTA